MSRAAVPTLVLLAATAAGLALPGESLAQGCAMCRTALEGQDESLLRAFNTSILFLLTMPYLIAGTIGGWVVWSIRRHRDAVEPNKGDAE